MKRNIVVLTLYLMIANAILTATFMVEFRLTLREEISGGIIFALSYGSFYPLLSDFEDMKGVIRFGNMVVLGTIVFSFFMVLIMGTSPGLH